MYRNNSVKQLYNDIDFLRCIIKRGRTMSMYEGSRLLSIANQYSVEIWYLCMELNKTYYNEIAELTAAGLQELRPSLN